MHYYVQHVIHEILSPENFKVFAYDSFGSFEANTSTNDNGNDDIHDNHGTGNEVICSRFFTRLRPTDIFM